MSLLSDHPPGLFPVHPSPECSKSLQADDVVGTPNRSESSEMTSKANLLKAFLMHIIKPSSQGLQRRKNFQPRPTRFCLMNSNGDGVAVS
ncbi:hypothetical protein L1049_004343 [Liquidambar formosana]|uniref:Uncharacterized protein n=1 Tax=Liquidambar formosana TaxID=63359 RepID=A0AAP0WY82_LIQFO